MATQLRAIESNAIEPEVACPECGHRFPLSKALVGPIEAQVARRLEAKYEQREREREEELARRLADATSHAVQKARTEHTMAMETLRQENTEQRDAIA